MDSVVALGQKGQWVSQLRLIPLHCLGLKEENDLISCLNNCLKVCMRSSWVSYVCKCVCG